MEGAMPAPEPQPPPNGALLFVYGTLRRGLVNHHWLAQAQWLGESSMVGVDLHDLGPFPMAIRGEGTVLGELYRVTESLLARLDRFEGVPRLYRRECLPLTDGRAAWIYLGQARQVRHSPRLPQGRWPAAESPPPADQGEGGSSRHRRRRSGTGEPL